MNTATFHRLPTNTPEPIHEIRVENELWGVVAGEPIETFGVDSLQAISGTPRMILRSQRDNSDAEGSFASWSTAGWEAFEVAVSEITKTLKSRDQPCQLIIWPGAGSVLSDAISTLTFARKDTGAGLLIDPVAWISETMLADSEDHLSRFAQALVLCESAVGVVVRPMPGVLSADKARELLEPVIAAVTSRNGIVLDCDALH